MPTRFAILHTSNFNRQKIISRQNYKLLIAIAKLFTLAVTTKNPRNPRIKHEGFVCALLGAKFTFCIHALISLRDEGVVLSELS
jgi:hypothetical protein